jgi:hypothetical protein
MWISEKNILILLRGLELHQCLKVMSLAAYCWPTPRYLIRIL